MRLLSVTAGRRLRAELAVLTHAGGQVLKGGASRALQRFPEVLSSLSKYPVYATCSSCGNLE